MLLRCVGTVRILNLFLEEGGTLHRCAEAEGVRQNEWGGGAGPPEPRPGRRRRRRKRRTGPVDVCEVGKKEQSNPI